jgi:hypothetical protein
VGSCCWVVCHLPWLMRAAVWPPEESCPRAPNGSASYLVQPVL